MRSSSSPPGAGSGRGAAVAYTSTSTSSPCSSIRSRRACVRLLKQMAFRDLHAHRFWLDVKSRNERAQALYRSEGFVEDGRLRESVRTDDGYDSLIVMSMLDREYEALCEARASGIEPRSGN